MSGVEPIIAAEAAAATTAAAAANTAAITAAEVAAAEVAAATAAETAAASAAAAAAETAAAETALAASAAEAAPAVAEPLMYLDPQFAAADPFGMGPNIAFKPEYAGENLIAQPVGGQMLTPQQMALEQYAQSAGIEPISAQQAALERFSQSAAAEGMSPAQAALENYAGSAESVLQQGSTPSFQDQAYQKFLRQGMDADMPGATWRSIQAGLQNNALNTIGSLPQYLGMPAPPPGAGKALQAARLLSPQQDRGTRTSVSPPMLNKGREVNLGAPIAGLLGGMQMPKRRRLSLI